MHRAGTTLFNMLDSVWQGGGDGDDDDDDDDILLGLDDIVTMMISEFCMAQFVRALLFSDARGLIFIYGGLQEQLAAFHGLVSFDDMLEIAAGVGRALDQLPGGVDCLMFPAEGDDHSGSNYRAQT